MIENPFIISEEYVSPEYFCDREEETEVLKSNIHNRRNTVLISHRRMGKSGLIAHVMQNAEIANSYIIFSIDLFPTSSLAEMILILSNEIVGKLKPKENQFLDKFISIVKSLRAGIKMNSLSGELEFNLSLGEISKPQETLQEIFKYLNESDTPCIIAIDEFQQIAEYPEKNVIALLRSYVQKCKNTRFIFAGSNRRMMDKLFNNPSEPFYMSCSSLYLDAIDKFKYWEFSKEHFTKNGYAIDKDCFETIYDEFEGHTWYVQRILNELFAKATKDNPATIDSYKKVLNFIVNSSKKTFEEQFKLYPEAQKSLLIAIAKEGKAKEITSMSFIRKHALKSPSTVQSASRYLYEKEIITKNNSEYNIENRFFSLWINSVYGSK